MFPVALVRLCLGAPHHPNGATWTCSIGQFAEKFHVGSFGPSLAVLLVSAVSKVIRAAVPLNPFTPHVRTFFVVCSRVGPGAQPVLRHDGRQPYAQ